MSTILKYKGKLGVDGLRDLLNLASRGIVIARTADTNSDGRVSGGEITSAIGSIALTALGNTSAFQKAWAEVGRGEIGTLEITELVEHVLTILNDYTPEKAQKLVVAVIKWVRASGELTQEIIDYTA